VGFINGLHPLYDQFVRILERTLLLVVVTMMPSALHLLTSSSLLISVPLLPTQMRTSLLM
jgi:hypothetical protein